MDAAAQLTGFTYDGTYDAHFDDYFITRIGNSAQTSNSFWGVLNNGAFTPTGGCNAQVQPGDSSLWLYDAFNMNIGLTITPAYAVTQAGSSIRILVTAQDIGGGSSSPYAGATLSGNGVRSDANGAVVFTAPTIPGCYQYKATTPGQGRSNAFYLNVVGSFPAIIE